MTHKLINTEKYLLVVSEDEIKEGDWYKTPYGIYSQFNGTEKLIDGTQKVSAHLPLKDSPILQGLDLLPPLEPLEQEDDFEKIIYDSDFRGDTKSFKSGYNKAKEKYKYTEEDIENAFNSGRGYGVPDNIKDLNSFIQSLSQPKLPVAFKQGNTVDGKTYTSVTRRHDGFTVWVGEYIY